MTELTDLEMCKRIAEIEGHDPCVEDYGVYITEFNVNYNCHESNAYNPLTDALNHQLMIKYECSIINVDEGMFIVQCEMVTVDTNDDTNLNKAILLAIIESKKDVNNEH